MSLDKIENLPAETDTREEVDKGLLALAVEEQLETLSDRERKILRHRYFDLMRAKDIGLKFNVTGERIIQIERKALRKLRHPKRADALRSAFLGVPVSDIVEERENKAKEKMREIRRFNIFYEKQQEKMLQKQGEIVLEKARKRKEWQNSFWKKNQKPGTDQEERRARMTHPFGGTDDIPPDFCKLARDHNGAAYIRVPFPYSITSKDAQYERWLKYLILKED